MFSGSCILFAAIGGNNACKFDGMGLTGCIFEYNCTNGGEGLFGGFIPDLMDN